MKKKNIVLIVLILIVCVGVALLIRFGNRADNTEPAAESSGIDPAPQTDEPAAADDEPEPPPAPDETELPEEDTPEMEIVDEVVTEIEDNMAVTGG